MQIGSPQELPDMAVFVSDMRQTVNSYRSFRASPTVEIHDGSESVASLQLGKQGVYKRVTEA